MTTYTSDQSVTDWSGGPTAFPSPGWDRSLRRSASWGPEAWTNWHSSALENPRAALYDHRVINGVHISANKREKTLQISIPHWALPSSSTSMQVANFLNFSNAIATYADRRNLMNDTAQQTRKLLPTESGQDMNLLVRHLQDWKPASEIGHPSGIIATMNRVPSSGEASHQLVCSVHGSERPVLCIEVRDFEGRVRTKGRRPPYGSHIALMTADSGTATSLANALVSEDLARLLGLERGKCSFPGNATDSNHLDSQVDFTFHYQPAAPTVRSQDPSNPDRRAYPSRAKLNALATPWTPAPGLTPRDIRRAIAYGIRLEQNNDQERTCFISPGLLTSFGFDRSLHPQLTADIAWNLLGSDSHQVDGFACKIAGGWLKARRRHSVILHSLYHSRNIYKTPVSGRVVMEKARDKGRVSSVGSFVDEGLTFVLRQNKPSSDDRGPPSSAPDAAVHDPTNSFAARSKDNQRLAPLTPIERVTLSVPRSEVPALYRSWLNKQEDELNLPLTDGPLRQLEAS